MLRSPLEFVCPLCGARPQEKCESHAGGSRFESHTLREWVAEDRNREQLFIETIPISEVPCRRWVSSVH